MAAGGDPLRFSAGSESALDLAKELGDENLLSLLQSAAVTKPTPEEIQPNSALKYVLHNNYIEPSAPKALTRW